MLADRPLSTEFHLDQHHYKMHIEISQAMFCSQWDNIVFITDKKVNWEKLIFKPRRHFRLQGEDRWKVDWEHAGSRGCWVAYDDDDDNYDDGVDSDNDANDDDNGDDDNLEFQFCPSQ